MSTSYHEIVHISGAIYHQLAKSCHCQSENLIYIRHKDTMIVPKFKKSYSVTMSCRSNLSYRIVHVWSIYRPVWYAQFICSKNTDGPVI